MIGEILLRNSNSNSSSYTLLELLVTMFIISVLASTVGSAAVRVWAKAEDLLCKNNLRQIGQGIFLYANMYDDSMPPADFSGVIDSWLNFFHAEILPDAKLYACPRQHVSNQFAPYGGNTPPYNQLRRASYVMNTIGHNQWRGAPLTTDPSRSSGWGNGTRQPIRLFHAINPAHSIMLTDAVDGLSSADARGIVHFGETDHGAIATERDTAIHHDGGFICLYGDGHVGWLWRSCPMQWVGSGFQK